MVTVNLARPLVSPKLLQLAQAVGEQDVGELLLSKAGPVAWVQGGGTGGGPCDGGGASCRWLHIWFTVATEEHGKRRACMGLVNSKCSVYKSQYNQRFQ